MAYIGVQRGNNSIVVGGHPLVQHLKVETATNMYPGRLVKKGTNDDDVVLNNSASGSIGWLGYEQTNDQYRPADEDTIYVAGDQAAVLNGGGFIIDALAVDTSANTIAKGDALMPAATLGGVLKFADTDPSTNKKMRVAIAEESVTIPAGGSVAILVRSLI